MSSPLWGRVCDRAKILRARRERTTLGAAYSPNTRPLPANQNSPVSSGNFTESKLGISAYASRTAACSPAGHNVLKIGISIINTALLSTRPVSKKTKG